MSALTVNEVPAADADVVAQATGALVVDLRQSTELTAVVGTVSALTLVSPDPNGVALTLNALTDVTELVRNGGGAITVDAAQASPTDLAPGTASAIILGIDGITGPRGPIGPPGPAGDGGIMRWHQAVAAAVWTVDHGLGFYPAISTTDTAGTQVYGDVRYPDENTVQITFGLAFAGYANLS